MSPDKLTLDEACHLVAALEIRNQQLHERLIVQAKQHQSDIEEMGNELSERYAELLNTQTIARELAEAERKQLGASFDLQIAEIQTKYLESNQLLRERLAECAAAIEFPVDTMARYLHSRYYRYAVVCGDHHPSMKWLFHRKCQDCNPMMTGYEQLTDDQREFYELMADSAQHFFYDLTNPVTKENSTNEVHR